MQRREEMDRPLRVYVLPALTPLGDPREMADFSEQLTEDCRRVLEETTDGRWRFHYGETHRLPDHDARFASDFLKEAHQRMVQAPADVVFVITDAALVSPRQKVVPGLASPEANVIVLSTRKLRTGAFGEPVRDLTEEVVRWNAATLGLHLIGHLLGLPHAPESDSLMAPFTFTADRREIPPMTPDSRSALRANLDDIRDYEIEVGRWWEKAAVHARLALQRPKQTFASALRSRAPLLPLSLTKMAAASVAPVFVFLFTDEFWWVGIHLEAVNVWSAAAVAVLAASWYVPVSQKLFFPHREKRVLTRHVALLNVSVWVTLLFAMAGLFVMVVLLILAIEWVLFPTDFMRGWFEGRSFEIGWAAHLHLAVVVSTLGTLTGALGGGFHGREIIREMALFLPDP